MKEEVEGMFKEVQSTLKNIVDFNNDIAITLHKAYLQATQAVMDGYSTVLKKALDRCETTAHHHTKAKD